MRRKRKLIRSKTINMRNEEKIKKVHDKEQNGKKKERHKRD